MFDNIIIQCMMFSLVIVLIYNKIKYDFKQTRQRIRNEIFNLFINDIKIDNMDFIITKIYNGNLYIDILIEMLNKYLSYNKNTFLIKKETPTSIRIISSNKNENEKIRIKIAELLTEFTIFKCIKKGNIK